ncbi:MAG: nuclease [Planctomycetota bacterium]|jgi:predicted nucleic acid-binding protein|nr:nuclease [Planctomycetota bacterium]MDP6503451.1 nuclease [Planctomycetota bacterium]
MTKQVLLDAGPLGMITHPRPNPEIASWLKQLLSAGVSVLAPEISDYEVRRELLRAGRQKGIQRLDALKETIGYVPLTTSAILKAAEFWARARNEGRPTADDRSLDADVILAAQAFVVAEQEGEVVIATGNVGHLSRFADARNWDEITEEDLT